MTDQHGLIRRSKGGWSSIGRFGKALAVRALPGLLNLFTLLTVGERLGASDFGVYSTIVATATVAGSLIFGPVLFGILPELSRTRQQIEEERYVSLVIGYVAFSLAAAVIVMIAFSSFSSIVLATVSVASLTVVQEVLRARLLVWSYGFTATVQAALFAFAAFSLVDAGEIETAIWIFGLSYFGALIVAYLLAGSPRPRFSGFALLRKTFSIGSSYTFTSLFDRALALGSRYVILIAGPPQLVGIYSFCLDLAERLVGFLVNAAGFVFVPLAYKVAHSNGSDERIFRKILQEGAVTGGAAAVLCLAGVLGVRYSGFLPDDVFLMLDPVMFVGVAAAVTVNRLKKISIDPVAMKRHRTSILLGGYAAAAPLTLGGVWLALELGATWAISTILLLGYLGASVVSWALLRRPALGNGRR